MLENMKYDFGDNIHEHTTSKCLKLGWNDIYFIPNIIPRCNSANLVFGLSLQYYNEVYNGPMAHNAAVYKASDHMAGKIDENELAYFGFPIWEFMSKKSDCVITYFEYFSHNSLHHSLGIVLI